MGSFTSKSISKSTTTPSLAGNPVSSSEASPSNGVNFHVVVIDRNNPLDTLLAVTLFGLSHVTALVYFSLKTLNPISKSASKYSRPASAAAFARSAPHVSSGVRRAPAQNGKNSEYLSTSATTSHSALRLTPLTIFLALYLFRSADAGADVDVAASPSSFAELDPTNDRGRDAEGEAPNPAIPPADVATAEGEDDDDATVTDDDDHAAVTGLANDDTARRIRGRPLRAATVAPSNLGSAPVRVQKPHG